MYQVSVVKKVKKVVTEEVTEQITLTSDNIGQFFQVGGGHMTHFWNELLGEGFDKGGVAECKALADILNMIGYKRKIYQIKALRSYYIA